MPLNDLKLKKCIVGNKFLQMMPTLIQSDLIRPNKLTRYQLNSGVSDINGLIWNIYALGTTLLGDSPRLF